MESRQEKSDKIDIPEIVYEGDDKKLKERVHKFKAGSFRIVIFTIVGLIMGAFSHTYVGDSFLPAKIILAIPYKLSEAIYTSVLGTDSVYLDSLFSIYYGRAMFPHSYLASLLAESVTTVLIGGAIYGSLAYFTGDKRVFTLQRFLKFAGCWCGVILLTIGAVYGVNTKALTDNDKLRGEPDFFLYHDYYDELGRKREGGRYVGDEQAAVLREKLYSGLETAQVKRNVDKEVEMQLVFGFEGAGPYARVGYYCVNYQDCYLVTEQGTIYRISDEFAAMVGTFYETGELPEEAGITSSERAEEAETK